MTDEASWARDMCLYDYRDYENRPWVERFPTEVVGGTHWELQSEGTGWCGAELPSPKDRPGRAADARPVLYVSHRKCDLQNALRLSWLADQAGFEVWLDVVNPNLQPLQSHVGAGPLSLAQTSLAVASIIEMGMLNATHLLLVMTPNTVGSAWLPYQFGRAANCEAGELQAASWASQQVPKSTLPEYLALGTQLFSETEYRSWLEREFRDWTLDHGSLARGPARRWKSAEPLEI